MTTAPAGEASASGSAPAVDTRTEPGRYRHWQLEVDGAVAHLRLDVDEDGALVPGHPLKLNSYDLGVDIELADAVQRLRFEHPGVRCVVLTSALPDVFCAGANIGMLAAASHHHKVNFCKFTNETRAAIEEASSASGQRWLCAVNGPAAGGGYELALACDHILLIDDNRSTVALPEVPLLGVLPGTGGLTRLVDKRRVRRDLADSLCTTAEGVRGRRALEWGLVDELAPRSRFEAAVAERAAAMAATSDRPAAAEGVRLTPVERQGDGDQIRWPTLHLAVDRALRAVTLTVLGPEQAAPTDAEAALERGDALWPLAMARDLDDALLHLRFNEPGLGTLVLRSQGDAAAVRGHDALLAGPGSAHWFLREVVLMLGRTLRRLELSSRSVVTLVEPGSCFVGSVAELVLVADRSLMLQDQADGGATLELGPLNLGPLRATNGITRLLAHFSGREDLAARAAQAAGRPLDASEALDLGLVTAAPDDLDWDDEVRILLEERASFSADALTAMEASLRFPGPETMDSKIFARLSAWQNWVFQRPNATGPEGALRRYGTGRRPVYDNRRV